jgi:hypothetical protein
LWKRTFFPSRTFERIEQVKCPARREFADQFCGGSIGNTQFGHLSANVLCRFDSADQLAGFAMIEQECALPFDGRHLVHPRPAMHGFIADENIVLLPGQVFRQILYSSHFNGSRQAGRLPRASRFP